ncbi:MAG TPA: antirestriction protein ArdA [Acidimicrobiales bacterium]|nr:antirestriction protein ArdA [Acidimicrobiales bacterium]
MNERGPETEGGGNNREAEGSGEQAPALAPRIYVASLSDYNAGRLHGEWIDAAVDSEELAGSVQAILRTSPEPGAEEWAIHDYEGFGPLRLEEYESLETISAVAQGIAEYGPAFAHWAALIGTNDNEALARFEDAYLGHWDSMTAYAEEFLDDIGVYRQIEEALPDHLQPYVKIDVEGMARDMEVGGQITTSSGDGGVYVFDGGV